MDSPPDSLLSTTVYLVAGGLCRVVDRRHNRAQSSVHNANPEIISVLRDQISNTTPRTEIAIAHKERLLEMACCVKGGIRATRVTTNTVP